jgi:hypothetical protein
VLAAKIDCNASSRDLTYMRPLLIASTLLASWLGMQAVHESGHAGAAWLTGGEVKRVVLHPATISRTDLTSNPYPVVAAWAGPVWGAVAPIVMWLAAAAMRTSGAFLLRFFAGFCLVANGLYLGVGSFSRAGDCDDLLNHGAKIWQLWLFGLITVPVGICLWHGQGRNFGLGRSAAPVSRAHAVLATAMWVLLACIGLLFT